MRYIAVGRINQCQCLSKNPMRGIISRGQSHCCDYFTCTIYIKIHAEQHIDTSTAVFEYCMLKLEIVPLANLCPCFACSFFIAVYNYVIFSDSGSEIENLV